MTFMRKRKVKQSVGWALNKAESKVGAFNHWDLNTNHLELSPTNQLLGIFR